MRFKTLVSDADGMGLWSKVGRALETAGMRSIVVVKPREVEGATLVDEHVLLIQRRPLRPARRD